MSTTFPNARQSFKRWEDLTQQQLTAYVNYVNALNRGDWTAAQNIFMNGNLKYTMLPTAKDFNDMCDTILECRRLYEAPTTSAQGIQDFMGQFSYKGDFNPAHISQYKKFALVRYTGVLYMAVADITSTQSPDRNTSQWVGVHPVSYSNTFSTYRGIWNVGTTYTAGDVVVRRNVMYVALSDSYGSEPSATSSYWAEIFDFAGYAVQLSPTEPQNLPAGAVWLKEL